MLQERAFPIIHELIQDAVSRVRIPSSPPAMIGRGEHRVGKQRVDEMAPHTRGWEEGDSKNWRVSRVHCICVFRLDVTNKMTSISGDTEAIAGLRAQFEDVPNDPR